MVVVIIAAALAREPLFAQAEVRIVDGAGLAIPAARIDVYGTAELLGVASSGHDGIADLTIDRWDEVRRISVSHLGFQTLIVQADELVEGATYRLEPEALRVEGLNVEVRGGSLCPLDDSQEARSMWTGVASRYSTDTGLRPIMASYLYGSGSIRETRIHHINESGLQRINGSRNPQGSQRGTGPLEARIARDGYSWEPARFRYGRRDLHRTYPSLEMWDAYHFATATFGDRHDFTVVRSNDRSTVLGFCPKPDSDGTGLMGTLELVPEDRLLSADWKFVVEDPDENAGGQVDFETHAMGPMELPHLLARRGVFFRHNGKKPPYPNLPRAYYREAVAQVDWQVLRWGR